MCDQAASASCAVLLPAHPPPMPACIPLCCADTHLPTHLPTHKHLPTPKQKFEDSLADLQTSYVDLVLLHYPACWGGLCGKAQPEGTWQDRWGAMLSGVWVRVWTGTRRGVGACPCT